MRAVRLAQDFALEEQHQVIHAAPGMTLLARERIGSRQRAPPVAGSGTDQIPAFFLEGRVVAELVLVGEFERHDFCPITEPTVLTAMLKAFMVSE